MEKITQTMNITMVTMVPDDSDAIAVSPMRSTTTGLMRMSQTMGTATTRSRVQMSPPANDMRNPLSPCALTIIFFLFAKKHPFRYGIA